MFRLVDPSTAAVSAGRPRLPVTTSWAPSSCLSSACPALPDAFIAIVQTAKRHNVGAMRLAEALVAAAEKDDTRVFDDEVLAAVDQTWGYLLQT